MLGNVNKLKHYAIQTIHRDIGHLKGMLVDENARAIRYLSMETGSWWPEHEAGIVPQWIHSVSWIKRVFSVYETRQTVKDSPPYERDAPAEHRHEIGIYDHYGETGYWAEEGGSATRP